ncbi:MAG: hypothetical protein IJW40_03060 [Clostridia bacterium]|nr:hypothetical protein [Clostridia bacterium]
MKQTLTRVLLLILAFVMCFSLYACADTKDDDQEGTQNPDPENVTPDEDPEEPQVLPDVEIKDYDYTLNVMHWMVGEDPEGWCPWNEIAPAEGVTGPIGDLIEDKIYDRTGWLEENYGITITNTYQSHANIPTTVANLLSSGSDEYQMLIEFGYDAQRVMGKNYFLDLAVMPNLDFDKPWWVKESLEQLAIGEFIEFAASDMLILDKGATTMMFYNIPMADDLSLSNLYELVDDGSWTIEEMAACAELAYRDDGNDVRDEFDTFGISGGDDPVLNLYVGAGMKFIDRDAEGDYYYSYGSDEMTLEVMTTILEDVMYQDFFWNSWLTRNEVTENQPSFKKDQALFSFSMAKSCNSYRDMESAYGILPIPKYDEYQDQYYSQVHSYHDSLMAVFSTAGSGDDSAIDAIGAAIEVLSYYSYYNIYPQFYEVVIQGRGTRDEESRQMLNLIFSTRTYDLGLVYDPNGFSDKVLRYTANGDTNLSSFVATWQDQLDVAMDDLNDLASTYW